MAMKRLIASAAFLSILALPALAPSAEKGQGGMHGMKMEGHGTMEQGQGMQGAHDMMKMGDRVYQGKIGPWNGEVRIMDMKASMEASGMKPQGGMMHSHHVSVALTDPQTKKPLTGGSGSVTVIAPDKSMTTTQFMVIQGHYGADVKLTTPGMYRFKVNLGTDGKMGTANFQYESK